MTPQLASTQSLDEIYALLRTATARKQPVAGMYEGLLRLLCPHVLGRSREGRLHAFCYQFGGNSGSGLRIGPEGIGGWRCIAVDKLSQLGLRTDAWRTEPRSSQQNCVQEIDIDCDAQRGGRPQKGQ
jgi:hypothetical protein